MTATVDAPSVSATTSGGRRTKQDDGQVEASVVRVASDGLPVVDLATLREMLAIESLRGSLPSEAAASVRARARPDAEAAEYIAILAWHRLAQSVSRGLNKAEGEDDEPAEALIVATPRRTYQVRRNADILQRVRLVVGGANKRLLDMTLSDVASLRDRAAAQEAGWASQEHAFGVAVGLLNLNKVDRVASLNKSALATLRDAMDAVTSW